MKIIINGTETEVYDEETARKQQNNKICGIWFNFGGLLMFIGTCVVVCGALDANSDFSFSKTVLIATFLLVGGWMMCAISSNKGGF